MDYDGFRSWLQETCTYTEPTVKDMVSRLRRSNNILEFVNEDVYLFRLSQMEEFKSASVSVKSQIRRAVKLYLQYLKETGTCEK